ncbi:MAG TPA: ABC transporter ATP-binding protein [Chloroflexi bacterium]|jgi:branched-chain amino acid transport system ATP-binding protein|nr:ABC transporter ATP-binding protein [Chloroflexota bacterium]
MAQLELKGVVAAYGPISALHGVSLSVNAGGIVALLGANGAGKTTTLRAISGTVRKTGSVVFDGHDISKRAPEHIARLGIAHVPEGRGTLGQLTVWENLQMGAYIRRDSKGIKADYDRVCEYFAWIPARRKQLAATLSGGEQQMLAIARALMMRPRLLLLDEPSLGLAPIVVREIFRIVRAVNERDKVTVLVVEQNASIALEAAAHAYVLEAGRVAVSGTSAELQKDEAVRRSYLGY